MGIPRRNKKRNNTDRRIHATSRRSRLGIERLESRQLLAADYQNAFLTLDVNDDGNVSALDALLVINPLNERGSGPLVPLSPGQSPTAFVDVSGDGTLAPIDALIVINKLNSTPPSAVNAPLTSSPNMRAQRSLASGSSSAMLNFSMREQSFEIAGDEALVRIVVTPAAGSNFNPGRITVRNASGAVVLERVSETNTAFTNASFLIVPLTLGDYSLEIAGEAGTSGEYVISASLVGDFDGDGLVNDADRMQIGALRTAGSFDIRGDADLDGLLTAKDYNFGRANTGDKTSLIAVAPVVGESQDDVVITLRSSEFVGAGTNSLLANDDFRNPFPVGLAVTSFQNRSSLGATVDVNPDGTFTYDPRGASQLAGLRPGQARSDKFTYKTSETDESTVTVIVQGEAEPTDDNYTADEDTILQIAAAAGVLVNDPGVTRTVTAFDSSSANGASVSVAVDGSFNYDPQVSVQIQQLPQGEILTDTFEYTSTAQDGSTTTSMVAVTVTGKNDSPVAAVDRIALTQADATFSGNVLANDFDLDAPTGTNRHGASSLAVTQSPTLSDGGATVTFSENGAFTYDATSLPAIPLLGLDEAFSDSFTYTISDGITTTIGTATIVIVGLDHPLVAQDDVYAVTFPHSISILSAQGVLANDSDFDSTDVISIDSYDRRSKLGGEVTVFEDGSVRYSSGPAFFDPNTGAVLIHEGETRVDEFTYTITNGQGDQKTATVRINVAGPTNPNLIDYSADYQATLTVPKESGLFVNTYLTNPQLVADSAAARKSRLNGNVQVNADGSFTYDPTPIDLLQVIQDADGAFYDSFDTVIFDQLGNFATLTARFKVLTNSSLAVLNQHDPQFDPSTTAVVQNGTLEIAHPAAAPFGGTTTTQVINIFDVASNQTLIRVVAMTKATNRQASPAQVINQRRVVGDFDPASFTAINFQGSSGDDVFFEHSQMNYVLTAAGGDGADWLEGGDGPATLDGGRGRDTVLAGGHAGSTLLGGLGNDELVGGGGNDILRGGPGNDELFGFGGIDSLFGDVGDDLLNGGGETDTLSGGPGADRLEDGSSDAEPSLIVNPNRSEGDVITNVPASSIITGVKAERQTVDDLKSTNNKLYVSVPAIIDNPSLTSGQVLILNSATMYGYTLTGNWSVTRDAAGRETFTNSGPLTISTGLGNVTFTSSAMTALSLTTTTDPFTGAGVADLASMVSWQQLVMSLIQGDSQSSSSFATQLKDSVGMELDFPQEIQFGMAFGGDIRNLTGWSGVPLATGLPYFYFRYAFGTDLVTLGDNSLGTNFGTVIIVAFDPLDPMLYLNVVPPVGGVSIGLGASKQGYIPFRPQHAIPTYFNRQGLGNSEIFGHVFLEGSIDISEFAPEIPLSVSGDMVLDLDANDDGTVVGGIGNLAGDILIDRKPAALRQAFGDLLGDIAVGMNGQIDLVAPLPGDVNPLGLAIPLGGATLLGKNKSIAFSGGSAQPFANVPFLSGLTMSQSNIQGFYNLQNRRFAVDYSLSAPKFYGVALSSNQQTFSISNEGASLSGTISTPVGLPVHVTGNLDFNTGRFEFTGSASYSIDLKVFHPTVQLRITLSNYVEGRYGLYFIGSFDAGFQSTPFDLAVRVDLRFFANQSGFDIFGSGRVDVRAIVLTGGIGFGLDNNGFSVDLPWPIPDIQASW